MIGDIESSFPDSVSLFYITPFSTRKLNVLHIAARLRSVVFAAVSAILNGSSGCFLLQIAVIMSNIVGQHSLLLSIVRGLGNQKHRYYIL